MGQYMRPVPESLLRISKPRRPQKPDYLGYFLVYGLPTIHVIAWIIAMYFVYKMSL